MIKKEHLTNEGLQKIVSLRASMNRGLSKTLKSYFFDVKLVLKPEIFFQKIKNSQWLSGFTNAETCFLVLIKKSGAVQLRFNITQHTRDYKLLESFVEFFWLW